MNERRTTVDSPDSLFDVDSLLDDDEKAIRRTVRQVVDERVKPRVADWYGKGHLPARELAKELGEVGLLGMHLEGYGCAGMSTTAYGLACLELEAGDSGIRSLVSVQGSLTMNAIWANGITSEYPVMRHANNLESVLTYEGTSEMHALILGQALTGIAAFR